MTAGIKHLQTKSWSHTTIDHFLHSVGYNISKPFSYIIIISISFLDLPTSILVLCHLELSCTVYSQLIRHSGQISALFACRSGGTWINPQIVRYLVFIILLINWCYTAEDWMWIGRDAMPKLSADHHTQTESNLQPNMHWAASTSLSNFSKMYLRLVSLAKDPG